MKLRSVASVCVLAMVLGGIGVASAQKVESPNFNAVPNKKAFQKIPGKQKVSNATGMVKNMKGNLKKTSARFEAAQKKERDIRKVNCINEKLLSMKGFVKVSEQSYDQLKTAVSAKDNSAATHNYTLIVLSDDKVARLTGEAALCVGEIAEIDSKGESSYTPNPNIPPVDPIAEGDRLEIAPTFDRLPELTPFQ